MIVDGVYLEEVRCESCDNIIAIEEPYEQIGHGFICDKCGSDMRLCCEQWYDEDCGETFEQWYFDKI